MGKPRTELSRILKDILKSVDPKYENDHCYFVAPSKGMNYPCIKYEISSYSNQNADNKRYVNHTRYTITVIDTDPDSLLNEAIKKDDRLEYLSFDRPYVADHLYHFVYNLYF